MLFTHRLAARFFSANSEIIQLNQKIYSPKNLIMFHHTTFSIMALAIDFTISIVWKYIMEIKFIIFIIILIIIIIIKLRR